MTLIKRVVPKSDCRKYDTIQAAKASNANLIHLFILVLRCKRPVNRHSIAYQILSIFRWPHRFCTEALNVFKVKLVFSCINGSFFFRSKPSRWRTDRSFISSSANAAKKSTIGLPSAPSVFTTGCSVRLDIGLILYQSVLWKILIQIKEFLSAIGIIIKL